MSRIHIPGVIDLLAVSASPAIDTLAADPGMDREYCPSGPLLNRLVLKRLRSTLEVAGRPLPPVAPRGTVRPTPAQATLDERLSRAATLPDLGIGEETIDAIAAWVRGAARGRDIGSLAQQAVGRLFDGGYRGDRESWLAAVVLGKAPSNFNPLRLLLWGLTARVPRARALLARKVGGDASGLHGTGVAVHNLLEGLREMRKLHADRSARETLSPDAVLSRCIIAPKQVLRQAREPGLYLGSRLSRSTLVLLKLRRANDAQPGYDTAFMEGAWSVCPARRWVPAFLARVWQKACSESGQ